MRRLLLLSFLTIVSCSAPRVEQASSVVKTSDRCPAGHPHMLWKAESPGATVWLLGSIHMADSTLYPLDPVIMSAFLESPAMAVEIDVSDDSVAAEVGERMADEGMLSDERTLEQIIGPVLWQRVDSTARALGSMGEALLPMKPWLAALQIANLSILSTGIEAAYGIDVVLLDSAYALNKEVLSLETPASQIGIFAELPESTQVHYLQTTLDESAETQDQIDSLMSYWRCGNDAALEKMLLEEEFGKEGFGDLKARLYDARNQAMADTVATWMTQKRSVFVVVGTAHLIGKGSVVELLRAKGYTVTRR